MTDFDRIDAFNRNLDRLLSGAEPNGRGGNRIDQDALIPAALLAAVSFDAEVRPHPGLKERWQRESARPASRRGVRVARPALRWAWTAAALTLIALLAVFHQPVLASLGRIFGFAYLPEAGFVNLNAVRVLETAVTQRHDGRELTAARGMVTERGAEIWLEFSDAARPIDDAWLEAPDGQRFELLNWVYAPDEPGTQGVAALFPPLPADVNAVMLALPEGWRIPLVWVPGTESSLTPVDIRIAPTAAPEGQPTEPAAEDPAGAPSQAPAAELAPCAEAMEIEFCVQAAAWSAGELQVLLGTVPNGAYTPGSSYSPSMFDVPGAAQDLVLTAADGSQYPVNPDFIQVQGEPPNLASTLRFPGTKGAAGRLSLTVPAVLVTTPLSTEIVVDLGEHPQSGQTLSLDQTVDAAGLPVHFSRAELVGDGTSTLQLMLTSDPLDDSAPVRPYVLEPGRPEGILDRYGAGSGPDHLSISVELLQPTGLVTGELRIPLLSATLKARGPWTLTFDAPAEGVTLTPEPQVIEGGPFEPLPVGEPLPMDAYQFTGRALQPGDLLAAVHQDEYSLLYAAPPEGGFAAEPVAVLPGQVLAVYPHPDGGGIDYLTGEHDPVSFNTIYRQLYTLRFGEEHPRLLVGQFERSAYDFAWSYDGRFLAYLASDEQPGASYQRFVRLIDLMGCRTFAEACAPFTAETGSQDVYALAWSPVDHRLALGAAPQATETYGTSDIFLLELDAASYATRLTNLTGSAAINDMPPARWTPGGEALIYPCTTGANAINEYSLCRNNLRKGVDDVIVSPLPWNMQSLHLAAGRWLVDRSPVLVNGVYRLRAYDLERGETSTLLEWPASGKVPVETTVSPDGKWAAAVINDLGGLLVVDVESHEPTLVLGADSGRLFWAGWMK